MTNNDILANLKSRNFIKDIKSQILPILERNSDKIVFIREMQGLRDVLYFEEKNLEFYDYPVFVSLNAQTQISQLAGEHDIYGHFAEIYNNAITETKEIVQQLEDFFSNTNRTLFIEVGFKENELSNDEMWEVFNTMDKDRTKEPFQIMSSLYKYPEWYQVQNTSEFALIEDSLFYLKQAEVQLIQIEILEAYASIDTLLLAGKFDDILSTKSKIKLLENQLEKTSA